MTEQALLDLQNQAIDLSNDESYEEAIAILLELAKNLSQGEEVLPTQAVFYLLGRCYLNLEEYDKALEYYEISGKTEQCKGDAYGEMGLIYKDHGEFFTAMDYTKKALLAQHYDGEEVFDNFSAIEAWSSLAIASMNAYNEDQTVNVHEILRHLREVLILDRERFSAYQNCAVCFSVLRERKLQKEFEKVYKKQKIDDKKYQELFTALTNYCCDDSYPYYHFKLTIVDDAENRYCSPTFHGIKDELESEEKAYRIARRMKAIEPTIIVPIRRQTEIPYCEITLSEAACSRITSKLGGEAYMPEGFSYPVNTEGAPL